MDLELRYHSLEWLLEEYENKNTYFLENIW